MKKVGIIGIGGRTGTMFAFELKKIAEVFGIGKEKEIAKLKEGKILIDNKKEIIPYQGELILEDEFPKGIDFDFLFFCIKNPVFEAVRFYLKKIKENQKKIPVLFLSQNGIGAVNETLLALKEIFENEASVFRISLFNPVKKESFDDKEVISFSYPIKIAISKVKGGTKENEIFQFFKLGGFEVFLVPQSNWKNMEYSKLFLNLIGIPSAISGLSVREGFSKIEVFKEEVEALREYKKLVKRLGGKFLNFPGYPIKIFSLFLSLPFFILSLFRKKIGEFVEKGREGKLKELEEIDYYTGAILKLAKEIKLKIPINQKIFERAKNLIR